MESNLRKGNKKNLLTYDDLTGKTNRFIVPSLVDSVYKVSPVLTRLRTRNRTKFEGGRSIVQPLMYARLKGGPFARGQAFDVSYVQTDTSQNRLPRVAIRDGKPTLIDSDAEMQTRRNQINYLDRDRLSEWASHAEDAIVGSHGNF